MNVLQKLIKQKSQKKMTDSLSLYLVKFFFANLPSPNNQKKFSENSNKIILYESVFKIRTTNQLQIINVLLCSKIISNISKSIQIHLE